METADLHIMNTIEKKEWMSERMSKNYSFRFIKGKVGDCEDLINIGVECIETGEFFRYDYMYVGKS